MREKREKKFATGSVGEIGDTVEDNFRLAKLACARALGYFSPAIRALSPHFTDVKEARPGVRMTMAVDKYFRVYVGNEFVREMMQAALDVSAEKPCETCGGDSHHKLAYVGGVIGHEAYHVIRKHYKRFDISGFSNPNKWNTAADLELNDGLIEMYAAIQTPKLCLPPFGVWPEKYRNFPKSAGEWDLNPKKPVVEALLETVKAAKMVAMLSRSDADIKILVAAAKAHEEYYEKEMSYTDKTQDYAHHEVEQHGTEIWKLFDDNKIAEEYYMLLPDPPPCPKHGGQPQPGQPGCGEPGDEGEPGEGEGQPGDGHGEGVGPCTCPWETEHGSGVGGEARDYELGPPTNENPGVSEAEGKQISRAVAKKVVEGSKSRGTMPAGLERWAEEELGPAKYDWRSELNKACRWGGGRKFGFAKRSYKRQGLLSTPRILFPTKFSPVPNITVVFDTSGSMCDMALKAGLEEVSGVMKSIGANIRFTSVDAQASKLTDVKNIRDVKLVGGGGTDMCVGIDAALADKRRIPSVIIVMTDGYTGWPEHQLNKGKTTLIVCLVGEGTAPLESVPSWALAIKIEGEDPSVNRPDEAA